MRLPFRSAGFIATRTLMLARYPLRSLALLTALALMAAPATAQMIEVSDICSDPMTIGPQKLVVLQSKGWAQGDKTDTAAIKLIANAHIASFTVGMTDWLQRYRAIPTLADNFTNLIAGGSVTLWTKSDAVLAVSLQKTADDTEHLACYFASPPSDETMTLINRYGTPETVPDQGLTVMRFDETAIVMDPPVEYLMYSVFSRHQSYPEFTHPDGYRLERTQKPAY